jgi:hypothetical protein
MRTLIERQQAMLHVRLEGKSLDIPLRDLDLPAEPQAREVRAMVAQYLDVPEDRLQGYVVEYHASGNWTVRPEAVFG